MFISIDIGGTTIKYGVVDRAGNILKQSTMKTEDNKEIFVKNIVTIINSLKDEFEIEGVGMCAPGIIKEDGFMVAAGAIKSLYGENIKKEIEEQTGFAVTIANDANAAAIAEQWIGNATNMSNYVCLVLGTGVGGAVVINNQIYAGSNGMAGEFGWTMINELPDEGDIEVATLNKKSAVVNGLCVNYNRKNLLVNKNAKETYDAKEVFELEKQGDVIAKEVLTDFFTNLAVGIINVMSSFDPDGILIGGGISNNKEFEERLLKQIKEVKSRHASINRMSKMIETPVLMAKLKNDAGMIGAAFLIKEKIDN